jgi:hypothetical protein
MFDDFSLPSTKLSAGEARCEPIGEPASARKGEALLALVALDEGQGVGAVAQLRNPVLPRGHGAREAGLAQQLGGELAQA